MHHVHASAKLPWGKKFFIASSLGKKKKKKKWEQGEVRTRSVRELLISKPFSERKHSASAAHGSLQKIPSRQRTLLPP